MKRSNLMVTAGVATLGLLAGMVAMLAAKADSQSKLARVQPLPPGARATNPVSDANPGDSTDAKNDFKRIYRAMRAFISANDRFPTPTELEKFSDPLLGLTLTAKDFQHDSAKYSESYTPNQQYQYMYRYVNPRPDGTPRPAVPKDGERDVWLMTSDFTRSHMVVNPDGSSRRDIRGYFLVLWSDGAVEEIPHGEALGYGTDAYHTYTEFKGQAGLNPKNIKPMYESNDYAQVLVEGKPI